MATITILSGKGEVFPYIDRAKAYWESPAGTDVGNYDGTYRNQAKGIRLSWSCDCEGVARYLLRYGVKGEKKTEVDVGKACEYSLYNLYKATEYEWSVTAEYSDGRNTTESASFQTTALGPRVLEIDGIFNTRDVGGYLTKSGKRTKQGLLYRGGALNLHYAKDGTIIYPSDLTEKGKTVMSDELGIKTDLDLRGLGAESAYATESPIPNANLVYSKIDGYAEAFTQTENYKKIFSLFAKKESYPLYFHCTGGADRTGTVTFLLNGLLGVPEEELIRDYEFTTFSIYCKRSVQNAEFAGHFQAFRTGLEAFEGEGLAKKVENYLLSIGVTEEELCSIREIFLGD